LAIGLARAGFRHAAVLEKDAAACETFRENQRRHEHDVEGWTLVEGDASEYDYSRIAGDIYLVSGGPPCQPFSRGGKGLGHKDPRNMFPEAIRAVRELSPRAFVFENVHGLFTQAYATYFAYLYLQLNYPLLTKRKGENWKSHRARLEKHHTGNRGPSTYKVVYQVLNAADFGVAQKRHRIFLVGLRADVGVEWSFPQATHTYDALLYEQWVTGDYWLRHEIPRGKRRAMPPSLRPRVQKIEKNIERLGNAKPWLTVRDAIADLGPPAREGQETISNHIFIPGARSYDGHSGSHLDEPAKTLKAGDHGVPGGENMLRAINGKVRYFTVREAARLQTFPDDFVFRGAWTHTVRQLGNAVPVKLAEVIGRSVATAIAN
jgi:DNA (cytosine-5)-methyltransferase 1